MEIVILRHAEPEWTKDGFSVDNPPLTKRGFQQAELLAESLKLELFDEVLVSPLLRTQQTAAWQAGVAPVEAEVRWDGETVSSRFHLLAGKRPCGRHASTTAMKR